MSNYSANVLANNENTAWAQVLGLIGENWTILDVGCSSGNLGEELIDKKNAVVDGIEVDAEDAEQARKKLRNVQTLNVETAPNLTSLFRAKYDAVLLIDVIEHLVNPVGSLKKLRSLLKPDGVIIFSIPNMAHISVRLALLKGDFTYTQTGLLDKTHLHFYTHKEVQRIFETAGYRITTFTSSSLRYPDFQYEAKMKELGLRISDKKRFLEMLEKTRGNIYQFVGKAVPAKDKAPASAEAPITNAHEKDFKEMQKIFDGQRKHINFLEKSVELKDNHISNLEAIIDDLKHRSVLRLKRKQP